jgi:N-acetylglucosaminyldiphosphoundecaprenol N-acetyl-beta-D-mannosaminyltransferase
MFVKRDILGVQVSSVSFDEVLKYVAGKVKTTSEKIFIITPNPEIIMFASTHPAYKKILNSADLALCDGVGVLVAGMLLKRPFKERITGVDMMEKLCEMSVKNAMNIGLFGSGPGVAERAAKCLREKYPGIEITFAVSELDELMSKSSKEKKSNNNDLKKIMPSVDLLFVALGFPKQEEWISENLSHLPVRVAMGVGGAFDYISGDVKRAPFILRAVGLEWLYRLVTQPHRWRRQMALPHFFIKVLTKAKS